jgi:hypothetical protein
MLARSSGIGLIEDRSQALVVRNHQPATRHGQPRSDAPGALFGWPAGFLAMQLSESQISQGAIDVQIADSTRSHRLPAQADIIIGCDLGLTAMTHKTPDVPRPQQIDMFIIETLACEGKRHPLTTSHHQLDHSSSAPL